MACLKFDEEPGKPASGPDAASTAAELAAAIEADAQALVTILDRQRETLKDDAAKLQTLIAAANNALELARHLRALVASNLKS